MGEEIEDVSNNNLLRQTKSDSFWCVVLCCTLVGKRSSQGSYEEVAQTLVGTAHGEEQGTTARSLWERQAFQKSGGSLVVRERMPSNTWDDSLPEGPAVFIFVRRGSHQRQPELGPNGRDA